MISFMESTVYVHFCISRQLVDRIQPQP